MLGELFYWVINMSIVASVSGLIILLLRQIKGIPRRVIKVLWMIPLIRFWLPIGISSKYGLMALISQFTMKTVTICELSEGRYILLTNMIMCADSYFPIRFKTKLIEKAFTVSSIVWMVFFFAMLLTAINVYVATSAETKGAVFYKEKNVYLSDKITYPAVFGIFKPKILLPVGYNELDESTIEYVLLHERSHIRSFDNFFRVVAYLTAALHWYNPLAWVFLNCYYLDAECACDEAVLTKLKKGQRKEYAEMLVKCAEVKTVFVSAFGGMKLRTRVERILSFKKMTFFAAVLFSVLIMIIAYALLTNPAH